MIVSTSQLRYKSANLEEQLRARLCILNLLWPNILVYRRAACKGDGTFRAILISGTQPHWVHLNPSHIPHTCTSSHTGTKTRVDTAYLKECNVFFLQLVIMLDFHSNHFVRINATKFNVRCIGHEESSIKTSGPKSFSYT